MPDDETARNQKTKALIETQIRILSELVTPLGFKVSHAADEEGFMGKPVIDQPRRAYTLFGPGSEHGEIKILGPIPGDLPEDKLRKYFSEEINNNIR